MVLLRFGGCAFPVHRTSQLTFYSQADQETRLGRIRSNLKPLRSSQRLWTARVSGANDDTAGNNACVEVLLKQLFASREPS